MAERGTAPVFEYLALRSRSHLLSLGDVERVAAAIRLGATAILPTETGYMLATLATSEAAIRHAFAVKRRPLTNTMHVACSSIGMAQEFGVLTPFAVRLLGEFTPGPVTVVVRQSGRLPEHLVTLNGTVGIRVPEHPATLQVISAVGAPITASSLNLAGEQALGVDRDALATLNWPTDHVFVVRDDESICYDKPSTLVRMTDAEPEVLRSGPISADAVRAALRQTTTTA